MRKRIGIAMLGVLAIGTIWSFAYDWKIAAILYATAVALIVYSGVALWLIFGGEETSEKNPAGQMDDAFKPNQRNQNNGH